MFYVRRKVKGKFFICARMCVLAKGEGCLCKEKWVEHSVLQKGA